MATAGTLLRILSQNVRALMDARPELNTQAALARAADVDQRTVGRILNCENAPTAAQIEKIARAFGLEAWQLLVPNLNAADLPACVLSQSQTDAWLNIRVAAETLGRYKL